MSLERSRTGGNRAMLARRSLWTCAALILGMMVMPWSGPSYGLPRPDERWLRLESLHFTVVSNAGGATTRRIVADLESLRATLAALSPDTRLTSPVPTTIYVFKNDATFRPYKPRYNGRPAQLAGYFLSHEHGNYMAVDGDPDGEPQRLVYHEYLHEVLRNNHPALPLWLNEGMAELYSTFEVVDGVAKIGLPIRSHVAELSGQSLMPLAQLQAIDRTSRDYNEGSRQGLFYAQSWAMAHYLLIGNADRQAQTRAFLDALHEDLAPDAAFARAFGDSSRSLTREVESYIRAYQLPVLAAEVSWNTDTTMAVETIDHADVLFRLGDLLAHGDASQIEPAREHLMAALAVAPDHHAALARLAMLDQRQGKETAALARYRKAAVLAPDDPSIQFLFGNALLADLGEGPFSPTKVTDKTRSRMREARAALERSTAARPEYAEAWAQLGFTYTIEASPPPAARVALETAFRLLPSRMDVAFNLLLTYSRTGAWPEARYLVERVIAIRADEDTVTAAREVLLGYDIETANRLLAEAQFEAVLPVLERVRDTTSDAAMRKTMTQQIADVRVVIEEQRFVIAYNQAVTWANEGQLGQAVGVLEALIETLPAGDDRRQARELLARLRAARR